MKIVNKIYGHSNVFIWDRLMNTHAALVASHSCTIIRKSSIAAYKHQAKIEIKGSSMCSFYVPMFLCGSEMIHTAEKLNQKEYHIFTKKI